MLGEPIILSALLETGDTTHHLFYIKKITEIVGWYFSIHLKHSCSPLFKHLLISILLPGEFDLLFSSLLVWKSDLVQLLLECCIPGVGPQKAY